MYRAGGLRDSRNGAIITDFCAIPACPCVDASLWRRTVTDDRTETPMPSPPRLDVRLHHRHPHRTNPSHPVFRIKRTLLRDSLPSVEPGLAEGIGDEHPAATRQTSMALTDAHVATQPSFAAAFTIATISALTFYGSLAHAAPRSGAAGEEPFILPFPLTVDSLTAPLSIPKCQDPHQSGPGGLPRLSCALSAVAGM
jgi:hypothetical protein